MYLVTETAAERLATRLFKEGIAITPTLTTGKFGAKLKGSYLLTFKFELPKSIKNYDEMFDFLEKTMVELDVAYFGGHVTDEKRTQYLSGHMPKLPTKKLKPKNPLDNVLPFPKNPPPLPPE